MILIYTMLLTGVFFILGSRARITSSIHQRYPLWLARFMDCAMCSGAWYGLVVSVIFLALGYRYPGLEGWQASIVCFFGSVAWTPVVAALILAATDSIGMKASLVEENLEDPSEPSP